MIAVFIVVFTLIRNKQQESDRLSSILTMKQAWEIANVAAKEWSDDAIVIKIISTDYEDNENPENGTDGRRNCWTFIFHSEEKGMQYDMYVKDGMVYMPRETSSNVYTGIDMNSVQIDSDDAFKVAYNLGFTGGVDWAFGYHYMLQYYVMDNAEPCLLLSVRGINQEGREAILNLNPYTGEIFSLSEKKGYDEAGRSIWETSNNLPETSIEQKSDVNMSREEIMEKYDVYHDAKKYYMDPEELTDSIIRGIQGSRFSPYSETPSYLPEEWETLMTERYGDAWKEW